MRRWIWVTVAVVAVVAATTTVVVVYRRQRELASLTSTDPVQCQAADAEARQMTGPFVFGSKRVDVLGDSYAVGTTLSDPQRGAWPVLLAARENWTVTVRGIGRTGFVNGGYCGNQSFPTRVDEVLADDPELIIVEGGLNDAGQPGIGDAARELLAKVPPTVAVAVVGPIDAPGRRDADKQAIDRELAAAAGDRYIAPLGWQIEFGPDGIHPTQAGHIALADNIAAALAALPAPNAE